jgi:hypothetical protein
MKVLKSLLVLAIVGLVAGTAVAEEQMAQTAQTAQPPESLTAPIKGTVGYTFMTDYIWHGMNLTETLGGHQGTGASMMNYGLGLDLSDLSPDLAGTVWVTLDQVYFNRYDNTDASLAETSWAVIYNVACPFTDGDWTFAYRNINFNRVASLRHVDADTQEFSAKYGWNDGDFFRDMTGEEMGKKVLYPTIEYMADFDQATGGLLTFGLSHPFDLAQCDPQMTGLTLTPSWDIVVDHRYYGGLAESFGNGFISESGTASKTTKFAYMDFGLNLGANLSKMMNIKCGKLAANAGIAYVDSIEKFLDDTLYSYVGISFSW